MSTLALAADERVADVSFAADELIVRLMDGRRISAPLVWFPRLQSATTQQRLQYQISGAGYGIHWPDIDEDLSTEGLLRGAPSPESRSQRTLHPAVAYSGVNADLRLLQDFIGKSLGGRISDLEYRFRNQKRNSIENLLVESKLDWSLFKSALNVKRAAGQINEIVHSLGLLLLLPKILEPEEKIEYVSLGAANTGRSFDLETDLRIAEFTFIEWKGGSESTRHQKLFKDFFCLAEHNTSKSRYLYVVGDEHPLRFLRSGQSINSVLRRNVDLAKEFHDKYGEQFATVGEYFESRKNLVAVVSLEEMLQ